MSCFLKLFSLSKDLLEYVTYKTDLRKNMHSSTNMNNSFSSQIFLKTGSSDRWSCKEVVLTYIQKIEGPT